MRRILSVSLLLFLAACSEGGFDNGTPAPGTDAPGEEQGTGGREQGQQAALESYMLSGADLPDGCQPTPIATLDVDELTTNPLVSDDSDVIQQVSSLLGLDDALIETVDAALVSFFDPLGGVGLLGLEFETADNAADAYDMVREQFAAQGSQVELFRDGTMLLVAYDQVMNTSCYQAVRAFLPPLS